MIPETLLHQLARYRTDLVATSLYLDVDGRRQPRWADIEEKLDHLARVADAQAAMIGADAPRAVHDDMARIRQWLRGLDRSSIRGVAAFSCADHGLFETATFSRPLRDEIAVGPSLRIAPLAVALSDQPKSFAVLVDRAHARFFRYEGGEVSETSGPFDAIARAVDTDVELGGFDRRHAEELKEHVRSVARAVERIVHDFHPDFLLVGGANDAANELEASLQNGLPASLIVPIHVPANATRSNAAAVIVESTRALTRRAIAKLAGEMRDKAGSHATLGLASTLEALAARRVHKLLITRDLTARGCRCPSCGALDLPHAVYCVRCGALCDEIDDLAAAVIDEAIGQGVDVRFCDDELDAEGGIGSIIRFQGGDV